MHAGAWCSASVALTGMHNSQQGMTGKALRAAQRSLFLGLRCSGPFYSASADIPPCRLAHSASTAQRLLAASVHPVADAGGYAERAAARRAARKQDAPHPTQQHVLKTRNQAALPPPGHTAKNTSKEPASNGLEQRVTAATKREKSGFGEQQPGFVSMSDAFLAEMSALLEEPTGTQASNVAPAPSAAQRSSNAASSARAQNKAPSDARQERLRPSAAAADIARRKGGEVAGSSARKTSITRARDILASGSAWGQVSDDRPPGSHRRAAGLPHSSTAPQDSLDWDNLGLDAAAPGSGRLRAAKLEVDAAATSNGRVRAAGSLWDNQGKRQLTDDMSSGRPDNAPSWDGTPGGRGGGRQRGKEGPPARRPLRLTHRERVKLCLESNRRITDALEAVQVPHTFACPQQNAAL